MIPEGGATFAAGGGLLLEGEIFVGASPSPCPCVWLVLERNDDPGLRSLLSGRA